jgi:hypothetical protein
MKPCANKYRSLISAAVINPFTTDSDIVDGVNKHVASCSSCQIIYQREQKALKKLKQGGYDPTHQRI